MRVLRENRESIMSVLEAFIHDPLLEWSENSKQGTTSTDLAKKCVDVIDKKLKGSALTEFPLSVEGQVQDLLLEATDIGNLSEMYIGWCAAI